MNRTKKGWSTERRKGEPGGPLQRVLNKLRDTTDTQTDKTRAPECAEVVSHGKNYDAVAFSSLRTQFRFPADSATRLGARTASRDDICGAESVACVPIPHVEAWGADLI